MQYNKCIIDTNVPVKASYPVSEWEEEELELIHACIEFIHDFTNHPQSKLVLDMDWEVLREYQRRIRATDIGKQFLNWVYSYMARMDVVNDMIRLERSDEGYAAFPKEQALEEFDPADRKFIALALTHKEKPPIIQAADGKWLGFVEVFQKYGIHIAFLDQNYAESKFRKKKKKV